MQNENLKEKIDLVSTPEPVDIDESSTDLGQSLPASQTEEPNNQDFPSFGDRYQPLKIIGHGGMGVVYKAKDTVTGSIVAIKVLKKELTADKTALRRFEHEVESLSELDHANLVALHGQGHTADGAPYLVMEYIEGKSLSTILEEEKQLSPERAINLLLQIIEGLSHAHKKGIVHRDLKPSNIMISRPAEKFETDLIDGSQPSIETVSILDFGIARIVERTTGSTTGLTQTGDVFGTPNYMSPEQCEGKPIDAVSDIYSLGCIMFELLTGKLPFEGSNPIQVAVKHINDKPPGFPAEKRKRLRQPFKSLESITLFCLGKNKADRYQTIEEMADDLKRVRSGKNVKKSAEHDRSKRLNETVGLAIVAFLFLFFLFGSFGLISIFSLRPDSTPAGMVQSLYIALNLTGTLLLTYCVFRDRAVFRNSNRTMIDFWNLAESSTFAVSMWAILVLYALSISVDPGSNAGAFVTTPLGVLALITSTLGLIINLSFSLLGRVKKKLLDMPFSKKAARLQTSIAVGSACVLMVLVGILCPVVTAPVVGACAIGFAGISPYTAGLLADTAVRLDPESPQTIGLKVAVDLSRHKSKSEVLQTITNAITKSPGNAELYAVRAKAYITLDDEMSAIADYTNAIRYDDKAEYYSARAALNAKNDRELAALADYSEALKRDPSQTDLYTTRGVLYAKVKDFKPAIQDLNTAVASSPKYKQGEAYLRRGIVNELAGDKRMAAQDLELALKHKENLGDTFKMFIYKRLEMENEYAKGAADQYKKRSTADMKNDVSEALFGSVKLPFEW